MTITLERKQLNLEDERLPTGCHWPEDRSNTLIKIFLLLIYKENRKCSKTRTQVLELGPRDWILLFWVWSGLVIFDILELPAFQKYSICWVFYAICLCLCLCHHCMIEDIVLFAAIFHMRGLA